MSFKKLIQWSKSEFGSLPWRKNRTLYKTLVSEIMLQQTTVSTVKNYYENFLIKFPDLESLASASEEEVLIAWKGLGYYRRAKNLRLIAQEVSENFSGRFPQDLDQLKKIKGIGPYTLNALKAIGQDCEALALDANLERVIARFYLLKSPNQRLLHNEIMKLYGNSQIFPGVKAKRDLNQALMDLGRVYCQANKVYCELCPLNEQCLSLKTNEMLSLPIHKKEIKKGVNFEIELIRVIVKKNNQILCYQKNKNEWLSLQWEVPTFIFRTQDENLKQYPAWPKKLKFKVDREFYTGITKYKIKNIVVLMSENEWKKMSFERDLKFIRVDPRENLSTATFKCIKSRDKV